MTGSIEGVEVDEDIDNNNRMISTVRRSRQPYSV